MYDYYQEFLSEYKKTRTTQKCDLVAIYFVKLAKFKLSTMVNDIGRGKENT
jgi:hypothetical protein